MAAHSTHTHAHIDTAHVCTSTHNTHACIAGILHTHKHADTDTYRHVHTYIHMHEIVGRNTKDLRYVGNNTLVAESEEELRGL